MKRYAMIAALLALPGLAWGTDFVWTNGGGGLNLAWSHCGNWFYMGSPSPCYPAGNADEALIPKKSSGSWTIEIVDIQGLGQLKIYDSVTFTAASGTPELATGRLVINPAVAELTHDIVVVVQNGASIVKIGEN